MRKEVHFEYGSEFDHQDFYDAVERVEEVEVIEYDDKEGLTLTGTKKGVDQLLYREEYEFVKGSMRTMLGRQYTNQEDLPEAIRSEDPVVAEKTVVADGGPGLEDFDLVKVRESLSGGDKK